MATAIFIGAIAIAGAINPDYIEPASEGGQKIIAYLFIGFVVYDLIGLSRSRS